VTSSARTHSQIKFLVTSRPYYDIERRFAELTESFPTIRPQGEKESEAISREINIVIKWKVSELRRRLNLDDTEKLLLESELLSMAHRTYLWLKLILEVIHDEIGTTKKRLKQIIGTLPSTIV
jgi:ankyrin repeat domain-containing protein 50